MLGFFKKNQLDTKTNLINKQIITPKALRNCYNDQKDFESWREEIIILSSS